jgi:hypothetical protein
MRADEAKMKEVRHRDVMERILAMMAEEEAKLAQEERLERTDTAATSMPAQDANDRA